MATAVYVALGAFGFLSGKLVAGYCTILFSTGLSVVPWLR
jgi:hypothetical protein